MNAELGLLGATGTPSRLLALAMGFRVGNAATQLQQVLLKLCLEDRSRRDSLVLFGAELPRSANQTVHVLNRCNRSIAGISAGMIGNDPSKKRSFRADELDIA